MTSTYPRQRRVSMHRLSGVEVISSRSSQEVSYYSSMATYQQNDESTSRIGLSGDQRRGHLSFLLNATKPALHMLSLSSSS
jgi:hypothetical protein